jgi:hypothetical protein
MAAPEPVAPAGHVRVYLLEAAGLESRHRLADGCLFSKVDADIGGDQPIESAPADCANHHRVNLFALKRRQGSAHPMGVMLVGVYDRPVLATVRIYDQESRS